VLADEPMDAPPLATVYHLIILPDDAAFNWLVAPQSTEEGFAVTLVGTTGCETVTFTPFLVGFVHVLL
jgi:hypothetical protein